MLKIVPAASSVLNQAIIRLPSADALLPRFIILNAKFNHFKCKLIILRANLLPALAASEF